MLKLGNPLGTKKNKNILELQTSIKIFINILQALCFRKHGKQAQIVNLHKNTFSG